MIVERGYMISDITLFVLQIFDISRRIRAHTRSLGGSVLTAPDTPT
jgi:hypothetical protein